jgi:hypothetical protein
MTKGNSAGIKITTMILVAVGLISMLSAMRQMPFWTIEWNVKVLTSSKSGVAKLVISGGNKPNHNQDALRHIIQGSTDATQPSASIEH